MPNLLSYLRAAYREHTGIIVPHNLEWAPRTAPIILDWVVPTIFPTCDCFCFSTSMSAVHTYLIYSNHYRLIKTPAMTSNIVKV